MLNLGFYDTSIRRGHGVKIIDCAPFM